jgi:molybdopterin converting factor small subunit
MSVVVRYWAAARAAAGRDEESFDTPAHLAALVDAMGERHGDSLAHVLRRCSFLVDEVSPGRVELSTVRVPPGATVDVLPPFAGGAGVGGTAALGEGLRSP